MGGSYGGGRLPTTHWSLVARAGQDATEAQRQALGDLLGRYLPALRAHLIYGRRLSPEDTDDVLQDFVAAKILQTELIARADCQLGKFRTFLLTALDRFLIDRVRRQAARKRTPGQGELRGLVDLADRIQVEPRCDAFDLAWARSVIDRTVCLMRAQCEASGRTDVWVVFESRLLGPILDQAEPVEYEALVERLGLQSPSQASNLLITAKRMFARLMRAVVSEYTLGRPEIESEIGELTEILARARG